MMAESHTFTQWGPTCEEIINTHFPLHRACRDGDSEALSVLLSEGQHGVYIEDGFYGWTPAHWAAYFGKLACLRKLMQVTRVGADCDVRSSRFSQTPAHLAAFAGHPQCLQWLLQAGASVDAQDYLGETPIHKAARTGSMECCSLLISHGARLYICNNNGVTPAELARNCGFAECAKYVEAAARRQQSDAKGIYGEERVTSCLLPSPEDVTVAHHTANGCYTQQQQQQQNGISNGHVTNNCDMNDVEMDTCSRDIQSDDVPVSHDGGCVEEVAGNGDITISQAISTNQLPIAGRKRTQEVADGVCSKRQRTAELLTINDKQPQSNGCVASLAISGTDGGLCMRGEHLHALSKSCAVGQSLHDVIGGFRNGYSQRVHDASSFHSLQEVVDPSSVSSSADEHEDSIILARSYDSMCCEVMLGQNGSCHLY